MIVSAILPVIAAAVLCAVLFDVRQLAEQARLWVLAELGGQPIQETAPAVSTVRESASQASTRKVDNAYESLLKDLEPQVRSKEIAIERSEGRLEIHFVEKVLFLSGSAEVTSQGQAILAKTGRVLDGFDQEFFAIVGHTDNVPIKSGLYPSNWELSTARACSVVRFLSASAAIKPQRFYAVGRGEYEPAFSNDTDAGKAGNRRVDILVTDMQCLGQNKPASDQPLPPENETRQSN